MSGRTVRVRPPYAGKGTPAVPFADRRGIAATSTGDVVPVVAGRVAAAALA